MFKRGVGRRHADRTLRGYAAFGIGPVEIGFRAQDQRAGLPIEPGLAAADRAEYRCVRSRESYAASAERALVARQADAEIAAYVETAPVGDGAIRRRRRIDRRSGRGRRQISRLRAKGRERNNRD